MKRACRIVGLTAILVVGWIMAPRILPRSKGDTLPAPAEKADVERGRYLVEEVARCNECHTPRNAAGDLDPLQDLRGAPIWIMPVKPIQN